MWHVNQMQIKKTKGPWKISEAGLTSERKLNHPLERQWERVTQMMLALATAKMLRESRAKRGFDSPEQQMCN